MTTTRRPRKTILIPINEEYSLCIPETETLRVGRTDPVSQFILHLDKSSKETQPYANILKRPDGYDVTVACDCGCRQLLTRHVKTAQLAWWTVKMFNELTSRVLILAHFVQGE